MERLLIDCEDVLSYIWNCIFCSAFCLWFRWDFYLKAMGVTKKDSFEGEKILPHFQWVHYILTQYLWGEVLIVITPHTKVDSQKSTPGFCSTAAPQLNSSCAIGHKEKLKSIFKNFLLLELDRVDVHFLTGDSRFLHGRENKPSKQFNGNF